MKAKVLVTMLTLLIFVGQSLIAAVIPCQMGHMDMSVTEIASLEIDHTKMDHSSHQMSQSMEHDQTIMTECGLDCNCPMATCFSVIVTNTLTINSENIPSEKIAQPIVLASNQSPTFLYRPPINR